MEKFWGLSGTPIENNLSDLKPDEVNSETKIWKYNKYLILKLKHFQKHHSRRDKAQVLKDLKKSRKIL